MKIRSKLFFIFATTTVIPLIFVGFLSFYNAKESLSDSIARGLEYLVEAKFKDLEGFFGSLGNDLVVAQGYYNIKKNLPTISRLHNKTTDPEYIEAKKQLDDQFSVLVNTRGFFDAMLTNKSGSIVYVTNPSHKVEIGQHVDSFSLGFFEHGMEGLHFSDPMELDDYQKNGKRHIGILAAAPVTDLDGNGIGILIIEANLDRIYSLIRGRVDLGSTSETLLGEKINDKEILVLNHLLHEEGAALNKKIQIGGGLGVPLQMAVAGLTGSGIATDYRGVEVVAGWKPVKFANLDWGMVTKIDAIEAFAPVNNFRNVIILVISVEFLALVLVVFSASKTISDPIRKLQDGARVIAGGNLNYKVDTGTSDEVGQLSRAFDKMIDQLKESQFRYAELIETTPLCVKVFDAKGNLVFINKGGRDEHFIKEGDDISKWKWTDGIEESHKADVQKIFERALAGEKGYVEFKHTPEGSKHQWCSGTLTPVKDAGGNVRFVLFYSSDFTDLKNTQLNLEQKVRERTEDLMKFELAVENSVNHIIITDPEGTIIYANDAASKITGYSKIEMIGQKPSLWGKQMSKEFYEAMWRTIKVEKKTFQGEIKNKRKNGEVYISESFVSPVLDEDGNIKFFVGVEWDITKEKNLERIRRDFLSLASHQLRTPLSGTKWMVETLRSEKLGSLNKNQKEYMDELYGINERMIKLVFDMLSVLKFESGAVEAKIEKFTICSAVDKVTENLSAAAKNRNVELGSLLKNKGDIIIEADLEIFKTVLDILVSNAIDYSNSEQGVLLDVTEDKNTISISVKDSGIGIPRGEQQMIFSKFYRATNAKNHKPGGSGLGLYYAAMLAERIGGGVRFESEEGKGSTFYLVIKKNISKEVGNNKNNQTT